MPPVEIGESIFRQRIIGATGLNARVPVPRDVTLTSNLTVPDNVVLDFLMLGAKIIVNSPYILTINQEFLAPTYQIFSGTGTIVFGKKVPYIKPEWFGAKGDGSTDDKVALQLAANIANSNGGTLLLTGIYKISYSATTPLVIPCDIEIKKGSYFYLNAGTDLFNYPHILYIQGKINAGRYKIFEYENEYCEIDFTNRNTLGRIGVFSPSFTGNQELYPEWWGVVPGIQTEAQGILNSKYFNRMFRIHWGLNTRDTPVQYKLDSTKIYYVQGALKIRVQGFKMIGPTIITWIGSALNDSPCIQLGEGPSEDYNVIAGSDILTCEHWAFDELDVGRKIRITCGLQNPTISNQDYIITEYINQYQVRLNHTFTHTEEDIAGYFLNPQTALGTASRLYYCELKEIQLNRSSNPNGYGQIGLRLDHINNTNFEDISIGGFLIGVLRIGDIKYNNFIRCPINGCKYGYILDGSYTNSGGDPLSVATISDTKIQQVPMWGAILEGVNIGISNIDFSIIGGGQASAYIYPLSGSNYSDSQTIIIEHENATVPRVDTLILELDSNSSVSPGNLSIDISDNPSITLLSQRIATAINSSGTELTATSNSEKVTISDKNSLQPGTVPGYYDGVIRVYSNNIPSAIVDLNGSTIKAGDFFRINRNNYFELIDSVLYYNDKGRVYRQIDITGDTTVDQIKTSIIENINDSLILNKTTGPVLRGGLEFLKASDGGSGIVYLHYNGQDGLWYEKRLKVTFIGDYTAPVISYHTRFQSSLSAGSLILKNVQTSSIAFYSESVGHCWLRDTTPYYPTGSSRSSRHNNNIKSIWFYNSAGIIASDITALSATQYSAPIKGSAQYAAYLEFADNITIENCGSNGFRDAAIFIDDNSTGVKNLNTTSNDKYYLTNPYITSPDVPVQRFIDNSEDGFVSLTSRKYEIPLKFPYSKYSENFIKNPNNFGDENNNPNINYSRGSWNKYGTASKNIVISGHLTAPNEIDIAEILDIEESSIAGGDNYFFGQEFEGYINENLELSLWTKLITLGDKYTSGVSTRWNPYISITISWIDGPTTPDEVFNFLFTNEWHKHIGIIKTNYRGLARGLINIQIINWFDYTCSVWGICLKNKSQSENLSSQTTKPIYGKILPSISIAGSGCVNRISSSKDTLLLEPNNTDIVFSCQNGSPNAGWYRNDNTWRMIPTTIQKDFLYNFSAPISVPGEVYNDFIVSGIFPGDKSVVSFDQGESTGFLLSSSIIEKNKVRVKWTQLFGTAADPDGDGGHYNIEVIKSPSLVLDPYLTLSPGSFQEAELLFAATDAEPFFWKSIRGTDLDVITNNSLAMNNITIHNTELFYPLDKYVQSNKNTGSTHRNYRHKESNIHTIGTKDFCIELIFYYQDIAAIYPGWIWYGGTNYFLIYGNQGTPGAGKIIIGVKSSVGSGTVVNASTGLAHNDFCHLLYFVDRNENSTYGAQLYINSVKKHSSSIWATTITGELTDPNSYHSILATAGSKVISFGLWTGTTLWPGGSANETLWQTIATKRFRY